MTDINTRLATVDDAAAVAPLFDQYRQFYRQAPDIQLATEFISQRIANSESAVLVAETGTQDLAGFCQLYPSFCSVDAIPIYILYDLYVAPVARKQGVAHALMVAADALAMKRGGKRLELSTAKTNHIAQSLYEQLGWVRDNEFYYYSKSASKP